MTKNIDLKITKLVAPMENRTPAAMVRGFPMTDGAAAPTPVYSKFNTKILPNDDKAAIYYAYLCAVNWIVKKYAKDTVGMFLTIHTEDQWLMQCETAEKLPFLENKKAFTYRLVANKIVKENGLTVEFKFIPPIFEA